MTRDGPSACGARADGASSTRSVEPQPGLPTLTDVFTVDPDAITALCDGQMSPSATCALFANMAGEDVVVKPLDGAPSFDVPDMRVVRVTLARGINVTITGKSSGKIYLEGWPINGDRQVVFIDPLLAPVVQVRNGGFPWIVTAVVAGILALVMIIVVAHTNSRVNKACAPDISTLLGSPDSASPSPSPSPSSASPPSPNTPGGVNVPFAEQPPAVRRRLQWKLQQRCEVEKARGLKLSWFPIVLPLLVLGGALAGYFIIEGPGRKRATTKDCSARGGSWQPGYFKDASFITRSLCRVFGVCECINVTAQLNCAHEGFLRSQGKLSQILYVPSPHGIEDDIVRLTIEEARRRAAERERQGHGGERHGDAAGHGNVASATAQEAAAVPVVAGPAPAPAPAPAQPGVPLTPFLQWNQKRANQRRGWQCSCCPTAAAPKDDVCMDCSVWPCGYDAAACDSKSTASHAELQAAIKRTPHTDLRGIKDTSVYTCDSNPAAAMFHRFTSR